MKEDPHDDETGQVDPESPAWQEGILNGLNLYVTQLSDFLEAVASMGENLDEWIAALEDTAHIWNEQMAALSEVDLPRGLRREVEQLEERRDEYVQRIAELAEVLTRAATTTDPHN